MNNDGVDVSVIETEGEPTTFMADGKAIVFKDNNSEDKFVVFGVGAIIEDDGKVSDNALAFAREYLVPNVEAAFDCTATNELYEFKKEDKWVTYRSTPSVGLVGAILGTTESAMRI